MAARTPEQAVDAFLERLRPVVACVTTRPLIASGNRLAPHLNSVYFVPTDDPVVLHTRDRQGRALLFLRYDFVINRQTGSERGYAVNTSAYGYRILDRDRNEILAYHWHPAGLSRVTHPHLHLSNKIAPIDVGRSQEPLALADLHIATGPIEFATVVRMLIEEFDVQPQTDGWSDILSEHGTWPLT